MCFDLEHFSHSLVPMQSHQAILDFGAQGSALSPIASFKELVASVKPCMISCKDDIHKHLEYLNLSTTM